MPFFFSSISFGSDRVLVKRLYFVEQVFFGALAHLDAEHGEPVGDEAGGGHFAEDRREQEEVQQVHEERQA